MTYPKKVVQSVTDDFCSAFMKPDDFTGFSARMIAALELPAGVDPEDPRVIEIVAKCHKARPSPRKGRKGAR